MSTPTHRSDALSLLEARADRLEEKLAEVCRRLPAELRRELAQRFPELVSDDSAT